MRKRRMIEMESERASKRREIREERRRANKIKEETN